ncbi:MAG: hypothetical protein F4X35_02230 [Alphaproteobacteria bacterium]|nr:hypothetical protein [Alphaproteobacteria bacterium]
MGDSAKVRLIRAAQSGELREAFRQLAEIEGPQGPKFPHRVLLGLAARIVGRAHEPMLLELCHLVRAAVLGGANAREYGSPKPAGTGFEWLFWGVEKAQASAFRRAFSPVPGRPDRPPAAPREASGAAVPDQLHVGRQSVTVTYPDGRFEVRYGRMVDLAAMMELLVTVLGYRALVTALEPVAAPVVGRQDVSAAARELARTLYAWLGDHLPAAQAQRKFHAMIASLEATKGPDFSGEDIDDETVLHFWLRHVVPGEPGAATADFRGYRTTFLAFLTLARVLEAGSGISRFEHAAPVGTDFEAGEIEPVDGPGMPGAAEKDPLARLEEEPAAALKALNRREVALVRLPVTESEGVRRLPRSYLRAECFGRVQNRISQALRSKAGPAELTNAVAAAPEPGYPAQVEALEQAEAHLRRVAKACLYVLHRIAHGNRGQAGGADDRECDEGAPLQIDFRLLGEARKAFEGLNRAGFGRAALSDPRLAPAYRAVAESLPSVAERLRAVLRAFQDTDWEAAEVDDRPIFSAAFARLYQIDPDTSVRDSPAGRHGQAPADSNHKTRPPKPVVTLPRQQEREFQ